MVETSRVLVAPGLRTVAQPGWRAGVATAFTAVLDQPRLWLLGAVGFCLRGGILALTLPIIILPTQVEMRLLLGDYLGSSGFSDRLWPVLAAVASIGAALTIGVLLILARIELAAFRLLLRANRDWPGVGDQPGAGDGRRLFHELLGVQVLSFVAVLAAATPLAHAAIRTAYQEIIRPSSSAPIYERVFYALGPEIVLFATALIVIEFLSALLSRELLVRGDRRSLAGALAAAFVRPFRSPTRTFATALTGWILSAAFVIPAIWAIAVAWAAVRGAFLISVSLADLGDDLGMALVAVALAATFSLGVALGGFASALRAALWSVERLR